MTRSVWQISGGSGSRIYAETLLRYGVALLGPGDAGPWQRSRGDEAYGGSHVRRFAEELELGDILLLRTGISRIAAVGIVASGYLYLDAFDDVTGLDLQHARRVRWARLPEDHTFPGKPFGARPPRLSRVGSPVVLDFARRFVVSPPTVWQTAPLPSLPEEEPLIDCPPQELAALVGYAGDLLALVENVEAFGDYPSENEMVAHLVVPLLRSLGWRPEQVAVEWQDVDVAVFQSLPRTPSTCRFVLEVKRLGAGVEGALQQALQYVEGLNLEADVVVTDGVRYRLFSHRQGFKPGGYANLARLRPSGLTLFDALRPR